MFYSNPVSSTNSKPNLLVRVTRNAILKRTKYSSSNTFPVAIALIRTRNLYAYHTDGSSLLDHTYSSTLTVTLTMARHITLTRPNAIRTLPFLLICLVLLSPSSSSQVLAYDLLILSLSLTFTHTDTVTLTLTCTPTLTRTLTLTLNLAGTRTRALTSESLFNCDS